MDKKKRIEITERLGFGMLLASIGGFMDAYSYTVRGGVFATGQTGNLILVVFGLVNKDHALMGRAIVPILSFWIGVFAAQHLLYSVFSKIHIHWKRSVLFMEIVLLFIVGWIPVSAPNIIPNTLISFSAAMQFCCFRSFGENAAYATVFCTGNMRSCAEMFYKGIVQKEPGCLKKAYGYSGILVAFFSGACLSVASAGWVSEKAIWIAVALLLVAYILVHIYQLHADEKVFEEELKV